MTRIRWAVSLAMLGVFGCGSDPDDAITLVPVQGTVTLNGRPMADATVAFLPDPSNPASTAGGDTTGPEGNYLARYRGRSGLAPGKYKVTITPALSSDGPSAEASEAFAGDPFMAAEAGRAAAASKPASKTEEIKGEFDAEVTESGSTLDFDVKATAAAAGTRAASR